ncbi:MAG: NUDIX domain-containing protein [Saccharofermentans sp.]|nr:NUDIX domain-containing protein [Saccharofermentans sp.]
MRLRNMTGIYLSCKGKMLLLYRQNGRVVSDKWVASAGGHFEPDELNDPRACVLRELKEELGIGEVDIDNLTMRYIGIHHINGEIRQNYYFFADLKEYREFTSNEGISRWIETDKVTGLEMPLTAKYIMDHYMDIGRFDDILYCAVCDGEGYRFVPLKEM